jgi:hypothetical protein
MPVSVVIHPARRVIYMRLAGSVSPEDILQQRQHASQDPRFDATFDVLVDLREADLSNLSGQTIASLASTSMLRRSVRRVFIADSDVAFGVARMYETWTATAHVGEPLTIVRTIEEALQSLGLPGFDPSVESPTT